MDGYPRTFNDARECFLHKPDRFDENGDKIEDEEEDPDAPKSWAGYVVSEDIVPHSCIVLEGSDQELVKRVNNLPQCELVGTHYNPTDMARRLQAYRLANNSEVAEPSVQEFFATNCAMKTCAVACSMDAEKALDTFKIYIERVSCDNTDFCVIERAAFQLHDF